MPTQPTSDPSSTSIPPVVAPAAAPVVAPVGIAATVDSTSVPAGGELDSQGNTSAASPTPSPAPSRATTRKRNTVEIWNMPFDVVTLDESLEDIGLMIQQRDPTYVITANLNYVMLHNQQRDLEPVTRGAGMIVADGQPIVWRSKINGTILPERVAGSEMIYRLAETASQRGWSIYFLGGEPEVADACATKLVRMYPGLKIAGVESPPFRALTDEEQLEQDQRIQASGADILLVAFGQPKGEKWIYENHKRLGVPVSIQLGASFDFVAGTAKRAPKIWQKTGMEWFYRMASDPRRLLPRYAANAWFLCTAITGDWIRKVQSWGMGLDD